MIPDSVAATSMNMRMGQALNTVFISWVVLLSSAVSWTSSATLGAWTKGIYGMSLNATSSRLIPVMGKLKSYALSGWSSCSSSPRMESKIFPNFTVAELLQQTWSILFIMWGKMPSTAIWLPRLEGFEYGP